MWQNDWGNNFETEEDARDDACRRMGWDDFKYYMQYSITWDRLFDWARKQEGFFEAFENEFCEAENEFFEDNYYIVDDDEEE